MGTVASIEVWKEKSRKQYSSIEPKHHIDKCKGLQ